MSAAGTPLPPGTPLPDDRSAQDLALDRGVATMLRVGVTLAAVVVLAGGLWLLRHPLRATPDLRHFQAVELPLRSVRGTFAAAFRHRTGQSRAIIQAGLVLLIATPLARVVLCVAGFARERSWLYVVISLVVLTTLVWSLAPAV